MNVIIVFPSSFANKHILATTIRNAAPELISIDIEGDCIVCQSRDTVEQASRLASLFGIEKVAIAKKVANSFSDLLEAIVEVGTRLIMPGDTFYIKVIIQQVARQDYVTRDVEFAASGILTAKLASIKVRPAKTQEEARDLILAVVGREWAYVCIQVLDAAGGLVAGSQGQVLGSIHGSLSLISCLMAAKVGFDPVIVLAYVDERDLQANAKLTELFATKTGMKKQTILAVPISLPAKGPSAPLLKEKIISKILLNCYKDNSRIVLALSAAVHPIWLIESIMQETMAAGKTPFAPLIFMSSELIKYAEDAGVELDISATGVTAKDKIQKYNNTIESEVRMAIKRTKRLELKVGPNYLHDILDSI